MTSFHRLSLLRLVVLHGNQLSNNIVLLQESLLPALKRIHLLGIQSLKLVKGSIKILGQHILIEAPTRKASACIPAGKVAVWTTGAVEVATRCDIENAAAHGKKDRAVLLAVEGEESMGSVGSEDS